MENEMNGTEPKRRGRPRKEPTEETIQETIEAAEMDKNEILTRLGLLEGAVSSIRETLVDHNKRIAECSIQR